MRHNVNLLIEFILFITCNIIWYMLRFFILPFSCFGTRLNGQKFSRFANRVAKRFWHLRKPQIFIFSFF